LDAFHGLHGTAAPAPHNNPSLRLDLRSVSLDCADQTQEDPEHRLFSRHRALLSLAGVIAASSH
jgi:hypothetical protein